MNEIIVAFIAETVSLLKFRLFDNVSHYSFPLQPIAKKLDRISGRNYCPRFFPQRCLYSVTSGDKFHNRLAATWMR